MLLDVQFNGHKICNVEKYSIIVAAEAYLSSHYDVLM